MKARNLFVSFFILSVCALLYYNYGQIHQRADYATKFGIVVFVFFVAFVCLCYIVYMSYRTMHSEMTERMAMITESKNDLQTTYNSVSMFLIEVAYDFTILNVNEAVCSDLGRKRFYIIGKSLEEGLGFPEDAMELLKKLVSETFPSQSNGKEEVKVGGRIFEAFTFPMPEASGKLERVLLMLNDVTHVRAMYRQAMQDNKMTAIGQLAAGVAHEIRNPLGLIRNYCFLLKDETSWDEKMKLEAIEIMEQAVDRSSSIIDNLLRFSSLSSGNRIKINLKQAISAILSFEEHTLIKKNIQVTVTCKETITFDVVLESLEIILFNLIINAVDAMKNGGEIRIDAKEAESNIIIRVSDTGIGIPEEIHADIFNPFFTTKKNRNGGGLGLYIVYNEINKLNGTITMESEVGHGTTFIMTLPRERGEEADAE